MGRLLVNVRGPDEALAAANRGAHIADVAYPGSALVEKAGIAGSLFRAELSALWVIIGDVICVRGAACEPVEGDGRFGKVSSTVVSKLLPGVGAEHG